MITLQDGHNRYRLVLLHPEVELEAPEGDVTVFHRNWQKIERGHRQSTFWQAEDWAIARNLVKKHGVDKLTILARHFWWRHAEALFAGEGRPMLYFIRAIPAIQREIE